MPSYRTGEKEILQGLRFIPQFSQMVKEDLAVREREREKERKGERETLFGK